MMSPKEKLAKEKLIKLLRREGRATYARLFNEFDFNFTSDPNVVAYMEPSKGRIVCNKGLDMGQISTVIRHEILHEFLSHQMRMIDHISKKLGYDVNALTDEQRDEVLNKIYSNKKFNIAGDYEISNRGYTDEDKRNVRTIKLNDQVLTGLVTEDDHPDWVDLSLEDMYDKLIEEDPKDDMDPGDNGSSGGKQSNKNGSKNDGGSGDNSQPHEGVDHSGEIIYGTLQPDGTFIDEDGNIIGG